MNSQKLKYTASPKDGGPASGKGKCGEFYLDNRDQHFSYFPHELATCSLVAAAAAAAQSVRHTKAQCYQPCNALATLESCKTFLQL